MSSLVVVPWARRMGPRDPHEAHRVATPLELFFDLVFVVAIASAAAQLHHGLTAGHLGTVVGYTMVFFAIWWAWMNYTWFASAYDSDDVVYRLLTFTIMTGSLMLAAGVPDLFDDGQSGVVVAGYAVMRLGMVALWLRAARAHPDGRRTALTYAVGIAVVQVLWIARLLLDGQGVLMSTFFLLVLAELSVPVLAERFGGPTPFHPHHIAERFGLFTIIVLGGGDPGQRPSPAGRHCGTHRRRLGRSRGGAGHRRARRRGWHERLAGHAGRGRPAAGVLPVVALLQA